MTDQDHSDRDLAQALAASRVEAGMPPQETGITGTDEVQFGPATRSQIEYDQGQWGLTSYVQTGKNSAPEAIFDPEPAERKRDLDVPAFLRPSIQNHRLGALLTIYHEIPLIRNLFLNQNDTLRSYGSDKEWWAGKEIENPSSNDEYHEMDRELQRLMALLDDTERSYGSVDALANLQDVKRARYQYQEGVESAVLKLWASIFQQNHPGMVQQIFSQGVGNESEEDNPKEFAILDLRLPDKDSLQQTLYDICDDVLWPSLEPFELERSPYLSHMAEVIAFRIEGNDEHKSVDIPAIWYPDRYLKPARQAALDMRLQKRDVEDELKRMYNIENRLTNYLVNRKVIKVENLFKASLKHDEAEIKDDGPREIEDVDLTSSQRPSNAATKLSAELRKVMNSIDKKLLGIDK